MESTDTDTLHDPGQKKSRLPILIGIVLALTGGAGGFFAVESGLLFGDDAVETRHGDTGTGADYLDVAFVPVDPLVITLSTEKGLRHLKFAAQLEVPSGAKSKVEALLPRVVDVFNSYLRAVELSDLEKPSALLMFRAHLLRRAQLVLGDDAINNLLIMEFVLSQ